MPDNRGRWTTYHLNKTYNVKQGSSNEGSSNEGSSNGGSSNEGSFNEGSFNEGSFNESSFNEGSFNESSSNKGNTNESRDKNKKRLTNEELITLIKEVCSNDYKSLEEIGKEVDKSIKHLSDRIIPKMTESGDLIKLYSDNHPNQKYKSTNS